MKTILLVEDDKLLNSGLAFVLKKENYNVVSAYCYQEGFDLFCSQSIDIVLLDIGLPDKSGTALCQEIRKKSDVPIIFVTANDTEQDIMAGFRKGCDDYISKPFSIDILVQRIGAVLRRTLTAEKNVYEASDIKINFDKMSVTKNSENIRLTPTEYKLLEYLVKNKGQVLTRQILIEKLWDIDENFVDENSLSVYIRRLRQKLEYDGKNPKYIKTVFGIGYTWE